MKRHTLSAVAILIAAMAFANPVIKSSPKHPIRKNQKQSSEDCSRTSTQSVTREFPDCDGGTITITATASCTATASNCGDAAIQAVFCATAKASKAIIPPDLHCPQP
jgi:hypothetical protein